MKCSLLTLSTFIDGELAAERRSEVDAHLVGCARCSAGAATLSEEKARVGQLARVHVDPASVQSMLEQVGIPLDSVGPLPAVPATPPPSPTGDQLPWQEGAAGLALPWTPRKPVADAIAGVGMATASADVQADLPLDAVSSGGRELDDSSLAMEVASTHPSDAEHTLDEAWTAPHDQLPGSPAPAEPWETAVPPPIDNSAHEQGLWELQPTPAEPPPPPPPPPAPSPYTPPSFAPAPARMAAASGPAALWTRVRDAVAVRLALSRGADAAEDSLQIVSGGPMPQRTAMAPPPVTRATDAVAQQAGVVPAARAAAPAEEEVELSGFAHPSAAPARALKAAAGNEQAALDDRRPSHWRGGGDDRDRAAPADPSTWNAFAASSYPLEDDPLDKPPAVAPRMLGRHTRAVAREQIPIPTRVWRAMATLAAELRVQTTAAAASVQHRLSGISKGGPDNRMLAGVAGLGLIFVIVLLVGHTSPRPAATATRPAPTAAVTQPHQSAPAQSSGAAAQTSGPTATNVQSFGSGTSGFQLIRMRYGATAGYLRVVFDLGAVRGTAHGSPKVVVSFSDPKTMLVTFNGTLPAGSTGVPPAGKVISSVTLVSSTGQKTIYRFQLTRAITTTGFYLAAPTRFVLDLH